MTYYRSPITIPAGINVTRVHVGVLGRTDSDGQKVTNQTAAFVSSLQAHLDGGTIQPISCQLWEENGWNGLINALEHVQSGAKIDKRIVVKVQGL